jgi:asparagine N-glycosylation enzyme membrane subunit Stt3
MDIKRICRTNKEYIILLGILLIALALRLYTARFDYLLGADPWYYSRYPFG